MIAQPGVVHDHPEKSCGAEGFIGRITRFEVPANALLPFVDAKHQLRASPTILIGNAMHMLIKALEEIVLIVTLKGPLPDRAMGGRGKRLERGNQSIDVAHTEGLKLPSG